MLAAQCVADAANRLATHIHHTPLVSSATLNQWLGHHILFKLECQQKVGAFKSRGALNALLVAREAGQHFDEVVAYSSGNHGQAVAWASRILNTRATIFLPAGTSSIKAAAARAYGAEVIITTDRAAAELQTQDRCAAGALFVPPFDHDAVIAGQGTACLEALAYEDPIDAVFATCGGGGLLSGTWLACQLRSPRTQVFGAEPKRANDAARSHRAGKIIAYSGSAPATLADGARTLSVSARTFEYLRELEEIFEVEEQAIAYWTQWLAHLLKVSIEPTAAVAMAGACQWLARQSQKRIVMVIVSGGNLSPETWRNCWADDNLCTPPDQWLADRL